MSFEQMYEDYGSKPKLFILTLNWNGEEKLKKLIPSLHAAISELDIDTHWLVRDNGSKDNSVNLIREKYRGEHSIYEIGHNRDSFAAGMNFLFKKARWELNPNAEDSGDLILLLNNDVIIKDPKSLKRMIDLHEKTEADIVGARTLYTNTNKLQHAGVIFSNKYNMLPFHYRPGAESTAEDRKNRYFQAVTAAFCLVTVLAYDQVGLMDEGFRWAFEDIDLCLRVREAFGEKSVVYCGETEVYHEESASLKKNPVNKMFQPQNVERFRKKWTGKYKEDLQLYEGNPNYNVIK